MSNFISLTELPIPGLSIVCAEILLCLFWIAITKRFQDSLLVISLLLRSRCTLLCGIEISSMPQSRVWNVGVGFLR